VRRGVALRRVAIVAGLALAPLLVPVLSAHATPQGNPPASVAGMKIVFAAVGRKGSPNAGRTAIYTMNSNGTDLRQVTPAKANSGYSFPSFAFGGADIVYGSNGPGQPESLYLMHADGTHIVRLTTNHWIDAQPKMSPDGSTIAFTSFWSEFPPVGLFKMDVRTGLVSPLSGVGSPTGAVDSDSNWSPDGAKIVFVNGKGVGGKGVPTQIWWMNADGTDRRPLQIDSHWNVDPSLAPGDTAVAYGSYRGPGTPSVSPGGLGGLKVKPDHWHLAVKSLETGNITLLTQGDKCEKRLVTDPCTPDQASAFQPSFTPDGRGVGFQAALSQTTQCICVINDDGSSPRVLFETTKLAIQWWSWVKLTGGTHPTPLSAVPTSRLLFGGTNNLNRPFLGWSRPDRWGYTLATPKNGLIPVSARWVPGDRQIVFVAKVAVAQKYLTGSPPWPPGQTCHDHWTLSNLTSYLYPPVVRPADIPEYQVFEENADGTNVRQLTNPWTMDCQDAIDPGDLRGNMDPSVSPDGRYVIVTNMSSIDNETFLLRIDLHTGAVLNLTNATSGALPVADATGAWSPDGKTVAFVSGQANSEEITTMDMSGYHVQTITHDGDFNTAPQWSPNGQYLVYSSYRGTAGLPAVQQSQLAAAGNVPKAGWALVKLNVATGVQTVLTTGASGPAFDPVWSPDGTTIDFVSSGVSGQPDLYSIPAQGGQAMPIQITLRTHETFVDWR
jgi:Tol biopolymer transport system component